MTGDNSYGVGTLSYSFELTEFLYDTGTRSLLTEDQQEFAREIFDQVANFTNLEFVESSEAGADISVWREPMDSGTIGLGSNPSQNGSTAAIKDTFTSLTGTAKGVLLHEIGHALGLEHSFGNGTTMPSAYNSTNTTVMSYSGSSASKIGGETYGRWHNETYQIYDILSLQYKYGANHDYNSGNDTYNFDGVADSLYTIWDGNGNDTFSALSLETDVTIDIREGGAHVSHIGDSFIWVAFGANIENAVGGSGNDIIYGNDLNNALLGNAGDDILESNGGINSLVGGADTDTFVIRNSDSVGTDHIIDFDVYGGEVVKIIGFSNLQSFSDLNISSNKNGGVIIELSEDRSIVLSNVSIKALNSSHFVFENDLTVAPDIDELAPSTIEFQRIYATDYINNISAAEGRNDILYANDTGTTMTGSDGDNHFVSGYGNDVIITGEGNNNVTAPGSAGGNDLIIAGSGDDTIENYGFWYNNVEGSTIDAGDGDNSVSSNSGDDYITSGNGNDYINADSGADTIISGSGDDTIYGGHGADVIIYGNGNVFVMGGGDGDVIINSNTGIINPNSSILPSASIDGGNGNDTLMGTIGDDTILGGYDSDLVAGFGGDDLIEMGFGDDFWVNGNLGNDSIYGGFGNDSGMHGGRGDDHLYGEKGNDTLYGDFGNDVLNGGEHDDILHGGEGADDLIGGAGADIFAFDNGTVVEIQGSGGALVRYDNIYGDGHDIVHDFTSGEDLLQFSSAAFGSAHEIINHFENGVLSIDDYNSITLVGVSTLTESDIILV